MKPGFSRRRALKWPTVAAFIEQMNGQEGCWEWPVHRNTYGYGVTRHGGRRRGVHVLAFELSNGPIAAGLVVCHRCDNRACCNPAHLFAGTPAENNADMRLKGRAAGRERNPKAKLTEQQVEAIRASAAASRALGRQFGVSDTQIRRIRSGLHWPIR